MTLQPPSSPTPTLDLSRWRPVPLILMAVGGLGAVIGALVDLKQFGYAWLQSFMFYLSLGLGGLFLVHIHHLFDASWSVPIRRLVEHLSCLLGVMAALFIPIALLAPKIYPWMTSDPGHDHALHAKQPLFTRPMFYLVAVLCFAAWAFWAYRLRYWSLRQDQTGSVECTYRMRRLAAGGIFVFAITLTLAAIMWMKALQHQWFSTMYGVYYFAASVWTTLATVYVLAIVLERAGYLRGVMHETQYYFIGSILLAFTVFYAYIHFSQYFIIWNANMPEETFWYVVREKGSWWDVGMLLIFGHFFIPFLALLRIDAKLTLWVMAPLMVLAWSMHYFDMSFNIMPVARPDGFVLHWMDLACFLFMGGLLAKVYISFFLAHPPFPQKDPRFAEAMGVYVPPLPPAAAPSQGTVK